MFDLAWSEIALIAIVALVVIGPKDLPGAIRGISEGIRKMRRMAGEFQQQADELVKEAKLDELRNQISDVKSQISSIRNFDLKGEIEKTVDKDGTLRAGLSDPLTPSWKPSVDGTAATPAGTPAAPAPLTADNAPDFVPPSVAASYAPPPPPPPPVEAPAFVPPSYAPPPPAAPEPPASVAPPVSPAPALAEPARPANPTA